ncbi:PilZ domain-containing protein, partial [Thermodesulfobacteriota bacterium]
KIIRHTKSINVEFSIPDPINTTDDITYNFNAIYLRDEACGKQPALRISYPEKRLYPRVDPSPAHPLQVTIFLGDTLSTEQLANISEGGLGFYSNVENPAASPWLRFKIAFTLPDAMKIETMVVVRWYIALEKPKTVAGKQLKYYYGVEFEGLNIVQQETVVNYIIEREYESLYNE